MIRTIFMKEPNALYVSLSDTYNFLIENKILTQKQANKWIWNTKKALTKKLLVMFNQGETDNWTELLIPQFNDYFVQNITLLSSIPDYIPDNKQWNPKLSNFVKQFSFIHNSNDEVFEEEICYAFEKSTLENPFIHLNRYQLYDND